MTKRFIAKIKTAFSGVRSVDSALTHFNKAHAKLRACAAHHEEAAKRHEMAIEHAWEAHDAAKAEAARASSIANRIEAFTTC